jgi:hypothetical protein
MALPMIVNAHSGYKAESANNIAVGQLGVHTTH